MIGNRLLGAGDSILPPPTFISSSFTLSNVTSTTVTVAPPAGIQDGDLLVAIIVYGDAATSADYLLYGVPSGWTTPKSYTRQDAVNDLSTKDTFYISTKVASGESGDYVFTLDPGTSSTIHALVYILVYRNATRIHYIGKTEEITSDNHSYSSINVDYDGKLLLVSSCTQTPVTITTPPAGMTNVVSYTGTENSLHVYEKDQIAGDTGTVTMQVNSGGKLQPGCLLHIINNPVSIQPNYIGTTTAWTTTSSITLDNPASTIVGDLLIAFITSGDTLVDYCDWTLPATWTKLLLRPEQEPIVLIAYKYHKDGDATSHAFTSSESITNKSGAIVAYRHGVLRPTWENSAFGADPETAVSLFAQMPHVVNDLDQTVNLQFMARTSASGGAIVTCPVESWYAHWTDSDATSPSSAIRRLRGGAPKGDLGSYRVLGTLPCGIVTLSISPTRSEIKTPVLKSHSIQEFSTPISSFVINLPLHTNVGDLVFVVIYRDSQGTTYIPPVGWNIVTHTNIDGASHAYAYRVIEAGDASTATFTTAGSVNNTSFFVMTFADALVDVIGTPVANNTASSIAVTEDDSLLMFIWLDDNNAQTLSLTGMMSVIQPTDSSVNHAFIAIESIGTGASGTRTCSPPGSTKDASVLISLKPKY